MARGKAVTEERDGANGRANCQTQWAALEVHYPLFSTSLRWMRLLHSAFYSFPLFSEIFPHFRTQSPIAGYHCSPKYAHSIIVFVFFNGDSFATPHLLSQSQHLPPSLSLAIRPCFSLSLSLTCSPSVCCFFLASFWWWSCCCRIIIAIRVRLNWAPLLPAARASSFPFTECPRFQLKRRVSLWFGHTALGQAMGRTLSEIL